MNLIIKLQENLLNQSIINDPKFIRELLKTKAEVLPLYIFATQISKNISPDMLLTQSINVVTDTNSLLYPAIALRYGANPNLYVESVTYGTMHILIYAYVVLEGKTDKNILRNLIIMLIRSGSDIQLSKSKKEPISVEKYLIDKQYRNDFLYPKNYTTEDLILASILLDKPYPKINLQPRIFDFNSIKVLKTLQPGHNLYYSSTKFFLSGFEYIIENGIIADYTLINHLIYLLSLQKSKNYIIAVTQITEMLLSCINYDATFDKYQLEYLNSIDSEIASKISTAYDKNWWLKEDHNYNIEADQHIPQDYITGRTLSKSELKSILLENNLSESDYFLDKMKTLALSYDIQTEYWDTLTSADLETILNSKILLNVYPKDLALVTFARIIYNINYSNPKWVHEVFNRIKPKTESSKFIPTKYSVVKNIYTDPPVKINPPIEIEKVSDDTTNLLKSSLDNFYVASPPQSPK